jgi:predicted transposase YbfD/YdcC
VSTSAGGESGCDLSGLVGMVAQVPDPRNAQGKVYGLSFLLAVTLVVTLAGASGFRQIRDQVADLPQSLLAKLGAPWCHVRRRFRCPSEHAIRYVVEQVNTAELDRVVGSWLRSVMRATADGVVGLAGDGAVLNGAWTDEHGQCTVLSVMAHREAVTVGQVQVPAGTDEITQVTALLEVVPVLEGEEVVVTMDAAHTQSDTAEYVKGTRGFDYVMTVKGNQPQLSAAVFEKCLPLLKHDPDHVVEERGRGLIKRWETWITDAAGIDWPHVEQVACIRRNTDTVAGAWIRKEYAWLVTSGESPKVTAETVHEYIRGHWGIENKSHYPRDVTWREDAQQIYTGSSPQVLATLRNLALGLLRLNGFNKIKEATEWIARDRSRALPLLAT